MSTRRKAFDAAFGIGLPLIFIVFDPAVFRSTDFAGVPTGAFLGAFKAFCYVSFALAALALMTVIVRDRASPMAAGVLLAASLLAAGVGMVILPMSILGLLFYGLGLLGLSPFVASVVYLRAAFSSGSNTARRWRSFVPGAVALIVIAISAQIGTNRAVRWATQHSGRRAESWLRLAPFIYDADQLVWAYAVETAEERKRELAAAYRLMTGKSIDVRSQELAD